MGRFSLSVFAGVLGAGLVLTAGCDELSARRQIQEAGTLYTEGNFSEAAEKYQSALEKAPDLAIGHHNAALAELKLFRASTEEEDKLAHADRAAEHLKSYLESNPDDAAGVRSLLTRIWTDAGRYDDARAYWTSRLDEANEQDVTLDILLKLAGIERLAGEYAQAIEWHRERAELQDAEAEKVEVYLDIAQLQHSRLRKGELTGAERARVADVAIGVLQDAAELDPEHLKVQKFLASIYQHRAPAHGASWARKIDAATSNIYHRRAAELEEDTEGEATAEDEDDSEEAEDADGESDT